MKNNKKVPISIITGYLGSGKTTLLNEILKQENNQGLGMIINDLGSVNIDAKLVSSKSSVIDNQNEMIELQNGCICCTLRDEFMHQVEMLSNNPSIDKIIVEASGVSNPVSIAEGFIMYLETFKNCNFYLDSIVSVVDASRVYSEFLDDIKGYDSNNTDPDIINLIMDQIEFCNVIIINKCDLLTKEQLAETKEIIKQLQNEALMIETVNSKIDPKLVFTNKEFDYDKIYDSSAVSKSLERERIMHSDGVDDFGITSFVYDEKRPFNNDKFMEFLENNYPKQIIRTKGYIWFSDDDIHINLFETAGNNASITIFSNWIASLPKEDKKDAIDNYPEVLDNWDEVYGDRHNQIVIIGKNMDKQKIINDFNSCLENEENIKVNNDN